MNNHLKWVLGSVATGVGAYALLLGISKNQKKLPVFKAGSQEGLTPEQRYEQDKSAALKISIGLSASILAIYVILNNIDLEEFDIIKPQRKHYHRAHNRINKLKLAK